MARKKSLQDLMEAVTFAEAGESETAGKIALEIFPSEPESPQAERIVALSGAPGFSPVLIEKSLGIAERLGYGLIALSAPPALARWASVLRPRKPSKGDRLSVEEFQARALERRVPFVHAVQSGDPPAAVARLRRQFRRIAFLLIEADLAPKSRFAALSIPIFSLTDE